jgi:hypothetical protein
MGLLVHLFFAWRINRLTGSKTWPIAIAIFALPAFGVLPLSWILDLGLIST